MRQPRVLPILFAILFACTIRFAAFAQTSPAPIYLFNSLSSSLLALNADGTQTEYPLPVPPNAYVSPYDMSFTGDGTRVAYCPVDFGMMNPDGTTPTPPNAHLIVRDLPSQTELLNLDLGAAVGCRVTYRDDGAFLAVGIVRSLSADPAASAGQTWELLILEPTTGGVLARLDAANPAASGIAIPATGTFMPQVRGFNGANVTFAVLPYATGGIGQTPAYTWAIDSNTLLNADVWGNLASDSLPATGEIAWLAQDEGLPASEPSGPFPPFNVVRVGDAAGAARNVFHSPDWTLIEARFIDDGRRIALQELAPADPTRDPNAPIPARWIAVDRAANAAVLSTSGGYAQVRPAAGGYIILQTSPDAAFSTLDYVSAADGAITTLWTSAQMSSPVAWEIAWTQPITPASGLPPFAGG
jgi:hypothetical protein